MVGNILTSSGSWPFMLAVTVLAASSGAAQAPPQSASTRPLTLIELLERVRTRYPGMGTADSRVDVARGARRTAGVFPNPVLGLNLENASLPGRAPATGLDREVMTTASLPLEFVYQRGAKVRRADAELDAARAEGLAERQRIALDAAHAYYRAALAQVEVAVAQDLVVWLDSLVDYNRNRVSEGVMGESDLLRAELERDHALAELTLQQTMSVEAQGALGRFYGDSAATLPGPGSVWLPDAPLRIPADVHVVHAELQAARARLTAAGAGVGVAQSLIVRDLSAMAGLKRSAGTTTFLAGLSVPLPLLDQNGGDVSRARAEQAVATFELSAMERHIQTELAVATETSRLLAARVDAMRGPQDSVATPTGPTVRYLARADEARRITYGAFQEGAVPLLAVLDATRAWGEARTSYFRTLYAQHESVVALLAAHGRDLFTEIPLLLGAAKESPR